jgi:hypothetical protein
MGRLTYSGVAAFGDRSQWRVVALDVSLRRRMALARESYRFTVCSVWMRVGTFVKTGDDRDYTCLVLQCEDMCNRV